MAPVAGRRTGRLRKETVAAALERLQQAGNGVPAVVSVLEARRVVSRISTSKLENGLAAADSDGRIRDLFTFHQAHTGRWAVAIFSRHNLPRPHHSLHDLAALIDAVNDPERFTALLPPGVNVEEAISSLVRPCIRASAGNLLAACDFASIEARGPRGVLVNSTCWANSPRGLTYIRTSPRVCMGSRLPRRTPQNDRSAKVRFWAVDMACRLGGFAAQAAKNRIDLEAARITAEQVVDGYRDAYPLIAGARMPSLNGRVRRTGGLWHDVEAAAHAAIRFNESPFVGRCGFVYDGGALIVRLPSGRSIHYRNARIEQRVPRYCHDLGSKNIRGIPSSSTAPITKALQRMEASSSRTSCRRCAETCSQRVCWSVSDADLPLFCMFTTKLSWKQMAGMLTMPCGNRQL